MTEVRTMILALVIISAITIGMTTFTTALFSPYSINNPNNLTIFNTSSTLNTLVESSSSKLLEKGTERTDVVSLIWGFSEDSINSLFIILESSVLYRNIIYETANILNLPTWVPVLAILGITVFILFILISALWKWRI